MTTVNEIKTKINGEWVSYTPQTTVTEVHPIGTTTATSVTLGVVTTTSTPSDTTTHSGNVYGQSSGSSPYVFINNVTFALSNQFVKDSKLPAFIIPPDNFEIVSGKLNVYVTASSQGSSLVCSLYNTYSGSDVLIDSYAFVNENHTFTTDISDFNKLKLKVSFKDSSWGGVWWVTAKCNVSTNTTTYYA